MVQQGEDIKFTIQGNNEMPIDLNKQTIKVVVYLQCKCNDPNAKKEAVLSEVVNDEGEVIPNIVIGKISHDITKTMEEGQYNMEMLIQDKTSGDISIYTKKNIFTLECSMSKNLEL